MLRQRASIGLEVVFGCWCSNVDVSGIEWRVESRCRGGGGGVVVIIVVVGSRVLTVLNSKYSSVLD